jgi:hypothetical protein
MRGLDMAMMSLAAVMFAVIGPAPAQAQDASASAAALGEPRQLTLPPRDSGDAKGDVVDVSGLAEGHGAVSVLPNGRSCPANVMVIGGVSAQGPTPFDRMRNRGLGRSPATGLGSCASTSSDIDPAPVLTAPPRGAAPVAPATLAQNAAPVIGP